MGAPDGIRQGSLLFLHADEVDMVCHQAKTVEPEAVPLRVCPEELQIDPPVVVHEEDILLVVPALGNMVGFPRGYDAC